MRYADNPGHALQAVYTSHNHPQAHACALHVQPQSFNYTTSATGCHFHACHLHSGPTIKRSNTRQADVLASCTPHCNPYGPAIISPAEHTSGIKAQQQHLVDAASSVASATLTAGCLLLTRCASAIACSRSSISCSAVARRTRACHHPAHDHKQSHSSAGNSK